MMQNTIAVGSVIFVFWIGFIAFLGVDSLWSQEEPVASKGEAGKNLQVLEIDSVIELNKYMIEITKSLGVDCKFCHDIRNFPDDSNEHKMKSREMMVMLNEINGNYFKESDTKVTCFTCHKGQLEPINSSEEWQKLIENKEKK